MLKAAVERDEYSWAGVWMDGQRRGVGTVWMDGGEWRALITQVTLHEAVNTQDFLKIYLFLIGGPLLCNVVLASTVHQHESAIGVHMSPLS